MASRAERYVGSPWYAHETEIDRRVQEAIDTHPDLSSQLDAISAIRGHWHPDLKPGSALITIRAYMASSLTLDDAVSKLTSPINEAYTTADYGRAYHEAELVAATQRPLLSPAEAEEMWGHPPSPPASDPNPEPTASSSSSSSSPNDSKKPTIETLLWLLYFSILHVAKCTPYAPHPSPAQDKLLTLLATLKQHPDPPPPSPVTKPLQHDWIFGAHLRNDAGSGGGGGGIWSRLTLFGPSAREMWSEDPGGGSGFTDAEIASWTNVNAFVAAVSARGIAHFRNYGVWAMTAVLEVGENATIWNRVSALSRLRGVVPAAGAWVEVAGKGMWEGEMKMGGGERWRGWRKKFEKLVGREGLDEETREIARRAVERMLNIEEGGGHA
ncbi:hypothetical protein LTS18_013487 [Coniosporium uncinatum]|uniref:Uncharacterized protein n=1 Tax=Coniosporium uncinatum TaxID=93489 RepID=A0ACC3D905_9PEZI|nr:hypothetical protein LTS18_013487 [Coniosporium uncinatum]